MAKRTYTYDGSEWVGLTSTTADLSNYANMTTTPISGFRNAIINGGFDIWQRGTSFSPTNGSYNADRWLTWLDGSGSTRSITQQSFSPGSGVIPGQEPKYFLRYNQSVAGSGATYNYLLQKIEDVRTFAGQTVSISFWAKTSANTTIPGVLIGQAYGSGGSPSSFQYTTVATSVALTTSWTKFTYTVLVPSLSGKTLGTNPDSSLHLFFSLPINATFTFDVWGVQVEPGTRATPFEKRHIGTELALCQRYYQMLKSGATNSPVLTRIYSTQNNYDGMISYLVKPRISSGFNYSVNSPANVIHKPGIRWDTISSITFTDMGSYLHIACTPSADDGGAMLGMYLYGIDIFCNAEL
jgi:hypothetical protein